jgi:hypothetical protein
MGIEPTFEAWEAPVLPLNYTRRMAAVREFTTDSGQESPSYGRGMYLAALRMPADETRHSGLRDSMRCDIARCAHFPLTSGLMYLPGRKFQCNDVAQGSTHLGNTDISAKQWPVPVLAHELQYVRLRCGLQVEYPVEPHDIRRTDPLPGQLRPGDIKGIGLYFHGPQRAYLKLAVHGILVGTCTRPAWLYHHVRPARRDIQWLIQYQLRTGRNFVKLRVDIIFLSR